VIEPDFEFWQTGSDPGLPESAWRAFGRVTGDASGGFMALQLDFQKAGLPLSARMWSLEMLSMNTTNALATISINANNLGEVLGAAPFSGTGYALQMIGADGLGQNIQGRDLAFLPWFMGAPRQPGVAAGLSWITANVNLGTVDVWARGFVWGPRSQTIQGGPRRPVGSVFGT